MLPDQAVKILRDYISTNSAKVEQLLPDTVTKLSFLQFLNAWTIKKSNDPTVNDSDCEFMLLCAKLLNFYINREVLDTADTDKLLREWKEDG